MKRVWESDRAIASELAVILLMAVALCVSPVWADISVTGDVAPVDPGQWGSSTTLYVGETSVGSVTLDDGGSVDSAYISVGDQSGSAGVITITGAETDWDNRHMLYLARFGDGVLNITDGGYLNTWGGCIIAENPGATGAISVSGAGSSFWSRSEKNIDFMIGYSGNAALDITGGASVHNGNSLPAQIGYNAGSTGVVTVSGAGSLFTNSRDICVGNYGNGVLNISDGGLVEANRDTYVARHAGSTGVINFDNGTLDTEGFLGSMANLRGVGTMNATGLVSNIDLVFDATRGERQTFTFNGSGRDITVNLDADDDAPMGAGYSGAGSLSISDGFRLDSGNGYLGYLSGSTGAATVSGAGTRWNIDSDLHVGYYGDGVLNIADGATVAVGSTYLARYAGSTGAIVLDNGTLTTDGLIGALDDISGVGVINARGLVSDSALVFAAARGSVQTFTLNGDGRNITVNLNVSEGDGSLGAGYVGVGSLHISDGVTVNSDAGYLGYHPGSTGTATMSGDSAWVQFKNLYVGYHGAGSLAVSDESALSGDALWIGTHAESTGAVTLSGADTKWWGSESFYVGHGGDGALSITNGAAGSTKRHGYIGDLPGSTGSVTVSGAGTTWYHDASFYVGRFGDGALEISDGAFVDNGMCIIAEQSGSSGEVSISGPETIHTTYGYTVGHYGDGKLEIDNGATVNTHRLVDYRIGYFPGSSGAVTVDGAGTTWNINQPFASFMVGVFSQGVLEITNGAVVSGGGDHYIGQHVGSNGLVTVSNTGSSWIEFDDLYVGMFGNGVLNITDGGLVSNNGSVPGGVIADQPGSTGAVTVTGAGSTWVAMIVTVGGAGEGALDITDGGFVGSDTCLLGRESGSSGTLAVSGAGSTWTNTKRLTIGGFGSGVLNITNGGVVNSGDSNDLHTSIGSGLDSIGVVTVSGAGSQWINSDKLHIGEQGRGTLSITDGGSVSSVYVYIGYEAGFAGAAAVSGAGSTWDSPYLGVGYKGHGTLEITDGGAVNCVGGGAVGYSLGSTGAATVSGPGSTWTNSGPLAIGPYGSGALDITNGGVVSSTIGYIGYDHGSAGMVTVSGADSAWSNSGDLSIGQNGVGDLVIDNGGLVSVGGGLAIDINAGDDSFINMGRGGMLALAGDADDSLGDFLDLIDGTDAIRYFDEAVWDWADIIGATPGEDYALSYLTEGDLAGYTVLTVATVPEPAALTMLALGGLGVLRRRKRGTCK